MKNNFLAAALVAAAAGIAGAATAVIPQPAPLVDNRLAVRTEAAVRRAWGGTRQSPLHGWPGPGWSYAHVKRTARKRAKQLRNRLAQRGGSKRACRGARA